ncbi:MAG: hypothetical protein EZS28_007369 [Streblomastix strix]|uniref:Uncharacterized protein n=1 Tax=Streblomastix strix TaxID=222440 RepID=A0A5J4WQ41_9EUKA|nr:MAG: hypothetical protein EZS28_007369 [Streblomastix strix]
MYLWIIKLLENKRLSLIQNIPQETLVTDAAPQGWRATLELKTEEVLIAWDLWKRKEVRWTSNRKEMEAILIRSNNSSIVSNLRRLKAAPQLASGLKNLYKIIQHLGLQLGRLQYKFTTSVNIIPSVENRANSGIIRKPIQCDPNSLCINRPGGHEYTMNRSIQTYSGEKNPVDPSTYPNDSLDFNDIQIVMNYRDYGGTLIAWPTLVHNAATRKFKIEYPWTIEPNLDSESEYNSETSPSPTRQVCSLPQGYITDKGRELLTKFLDAV